MTRRGYRALCAAALVATLACASAVDAADYEGLRVAQIRFEPTVQPLPSDELLRLIAVGRGKPLRLRDVRESISRLYSTGRFEDVEVDAQASNGDVVITFRTDNRWFVGRQAIRGVKDPPSEAQVHNATKLNLGGEFTEGAVEQAVKNIKALLRANGFYASQVSTDVQREPSTEQVEIRFFVEPGDRAIFAPPIIRGETKRNLADVVRASGWRRWWGLGPFRPVTEANVQAGVQRIRRSLEKGDFLLSRVSLRGLEWDAKRRTATPTLEIFDGAPVSLAIDGVKLSRSKQRALIPVFQERGIDRELLNEGARNLAAYLQGQGYFDARADFTTSSEGGRQVVRFAVDRGPRYRLSSVAITGNTYFDAATIRERMSVEPVSAVRYRNGRFSQRLLDGDVAAIADLYRSNGFQEVRVTPESTTETRGENRYQSVSIKIDEGRQHLVEKLTIRGPGEAAQTAIRSLMQSTEGQPFSETVIAADRDSVLNLYFNNGYTGASFDWTVEPGSAIDRVSLVVDIVEGSRQVVREVLVGGLERTDRKLVYSRISLRPGDALSTGEIIASQKRLYDLGIFARVDTAIQNPGGLEEAKYVLFEVEEAKKYSFNAGFGAQVGRIGGGLQSFDSPAGATGFSPRLNVSLTRNNMLGFGHSLTFQGRVSNVQQRAQATYLAPHFRDRESLSLAFSALSDDSRDVRTFAARRAEAAVQMTERLSQANTIQGRYTLRRVDVDENSLKIQPQLIPRLAQPVRLGILSATFIQDRRDDPIDSKRGIYSSVDVGVASGYLGSQSNYFRLLGRNSSYHRIGRDLVFARTLTFGVQERLTGGPLRDVPLPERFYAGGAASHRGFPENQAGPRDLTTGFPIGGKALLMLGHEFRYPLIGDSLGAVLFHDMGNVYSRIGDISLRYRQRDQRDFQYAVQSAGIGLRYRTPIGPIRIDIAYSPNAPRFFGFEGTRDQLLFGTGRQTIRKINALQFHFSLGQTF